MEIDNMKLMLGAMWKIAGEFLLGALALAIVVAVATLAAWTVCRIADARYKMRLKQ